MNRHELHETLIKEGVDPTRFNVLGPDTFPDGASDVHLLRKRRSGVVGNSDFWEVYFAERGSQFDPRRFESESEACAAFLSIIRKQFG